jgi:hypothetical protein
MEEAILIGSGTFVEFEGVFAILTAHHVAKEIDLASSVGLVLVEQEHRSEIRSQFLEIIEIARGADESKGPDLALIRLPPAKASEIRAFKQFFKLAQYREGMLERRPDPHQGVWFLCGIPDALTKDEASESGFGRVRSYHGLCGATGPRREFTEGRFDFIDLDVEYPSAAGDVPQDLGGLSGGGVWFVPLRRQESGELHPADYVLAGVIFYQSPIVDGRRFMRCHGPRSVYQAVCDSLQKCS